MGGYPQAEHVFTRNQILMRLAERVRARKQIARAEADRLRVLSERRDIRGTTEELLLVTNDARAEAFNEVLQIIEEERKK